MMMLAIQDWTYSSAIIENVDKTISVPDLFEKYLTFCLFFFSFEMWMTMQTNGLSCRKINLFYYAHLHCMLDREWHEKKEEAKGVRKNPFKMNNCTFPIVSLVLCCFFSSSRICCVLLRIRCVVLRLVRCGGWISLCHNLSTVLNEFIRCQITWINNHMSKVNSVRTAAFWDAFTHSMQKAI